MSKTPKFSVRSNVTIIGTGLSGLVTGAVLARAGKKVIVLPDDNGSGVNAADLPFLPPMLTKGFERDTPMDRIFNELGVSVSLLRRTQELFKKSSSWLQIIFPFFRFTLYHDRNETLSNLKAGFGEKALSIKTLFDKSDTWNPVLYPFIYSQDLPPLRKGEWLNQLASWLLYQYKILKLKIQKASDFCKESGLDEDGIDYFNALCIFQSGRTLYQLSTLEFLKSLIFINYEPIAAIKGISGLSDLLIKVIKENKGEFLPLIPSSLHFEKRRVAGIQFQGKEGIGCDCLIWNPQKGGLQTEKGIKIIQLFYMVDEEAIPSSMGDFLVMKRTAELPFDQFNFLYLALTDRLTTAPKEGKKTSAKRGLVIHFAVKSDSVEKDEKDMEKEMKDRLIWLMPFAEKSLVFSGCRIHKPEIQLPSYLSKEVVRKIANGQRSVCPIVSLGGAFYYLPHPVTDFLVNPLLIKRGYDLANTIKAGKYN